MAGSKARGKRPPGNTSAAIVADCRPVGAIADELQAIETALGMLDEDQKTAEIDRDGARARDLRAQVERKKLELGDLNSQTSGLLKELGKIEGVAYTRSILSSQPVEGAWLQAGSFQPPLEYQGLAELVLNVPWASQKLGVPRSRQLRTEIEELETEAIGIEQKLVREEAQAA